MGASPAGDTVRFYPDDPAVWDTIPGPVPIQIRGPGGASLRLEGIDALETHFDPRFVGGGVLHQPKGRPPNCCASSGSTLYSALRAGRSRPPPTPPPSADTS